MNPDIGKLIKDYQRAGGYNNLGWRRTRSDDVRYAKWSGQTDDGKKHANDPTEDPFPWDGASDTRVRLADAIINENVDVLSTSFWRGVLRATPVEANDSGKSAVATTLLSYYRDNVMRSELCQEVQLAAQWGQQYGVSVIHVTWDRQISKKNHPISMDEIIAMAQQAPDGTALANLPGMIKDESQEDAVVEMVQAEMGMNKRRARKMVKELRENDVSEMPMDHVVKNAPSVTALKMHEDIYVAPETIELQHAPAIFRRQWMTEAQLKEAATNYGYSKEWVAQVMNTKGRVMDYANVINAEVNDLAFSDGTTENIFEVIYAYQRVIDEDGVPNVWCTVFHPAISKVSAKTEMLDYCHGNYPFFAYRRERLTRRLLDSRGVSEICATWQQEQKAQRDALYDRASLTVLPPFVYPARSSQVYRLQPGSAIPEMRPNEIRFLEPPKSSPNEALEVVNYVQAQADDYFGRFTDGVNPVSSQTKRQAMAENWLMTWSEVFGKVFELIQEYVSDEELMRISGTQPGFPQTPEEIAGKMDLRVSFDVRELDQDFMLRKMEIVSKMVLPEDTAGVIDRAALTNFKMQLLDPVLARMVIPEDKTGASGKVFDEVNQAVAFMALGNEPQYQEKDPTANMKMQFLQQIVQGNPKYQEMLQGDERFAELMQKYNQALQFQVQQEQNAQIGKIGVSPAQ